MAAYRWVYDSHHLQADCQELGSALEPYARQSSMGYLCLLLCVKQSAVSRGVGTYHEQTFCICKSPAEATVKLVTVWMHTDFNSTLI